MKMNVSTQTLLNEELIELLLKNYIITTGQTQIKDVLTISNDRTNNDDNDSSSTTVSCQTSTQTSTQTFIETDNYQIKEYMSKLPSDVIIGIAKYITVEDFYNFSRTCKKLYSSFYCASIWYNFLNRDYIKQFKTLKSPTDLYDTYRYFSTNTLKAKDLSIADMGKNWKLDEDDCAVLTDVCWFDVNGEFKYVTNGTYTVKCVIKIENVSGGLVGLDFIARHEGVEEPYKFSMSRICYDNLKGIGWQPLTCFKIKVDNPQLYTKVRIQIVNKKCYWKYGFSIKSIILKRDD
ncbi:hypothetical protein BCR32DRAFT_278584 [Anaeromyces robustus]|uniref:F-box domain-containing protein n=1 Tax=Anaeromyces robustus TaxID=1754192 RepID=A0A1Y1XAP2_9FUNG|nr:hypothetical protein BCR32DRAFT_278584 [Anaeromyces robustus]|eukprot:ORX82841.1 hypothetical protein BCR32DRAFT_278584 [Anaeromyces robustus]